MSQLEGQKLLQGNEGTGSGVPPTTELVGLSSLPSYSYLANLMSAYQVRNLKNEDPASFKNNILSFLQMRDYEGEGWKSPEKQRDLSIRFHWGHNHDFGDFALVGAQGNRHLELIAMFIDKFGCLPVDLSGYTVLDVGCWTGGTSLLLAAMGAHVVAIEEVKKYVRCLTYLKRVFDVRCLEPKDMSLYDCTSAEFQDSFDFVLFAGVLYHVTDPILALRIIFNCLKDGGKCLLETAVISSDHPILSYQGPSLVTGNEDDLSRRGWNWFIPSPKTLNQMLLDVGYVNVRVHEPINGRCFAVATREGHVDMLRAGLSVRTIR